MFPKVSIIIPFYNCSYVQQAVESALNQTYPNIEVIVVDDGSFKHAYKLRPYLKDITYVRKANGGTATALNLGISRAKGDYIAWLSSDDYFLPEKIERQMAFMKERNADFSFTNYHYIDKDENILIPWCGKRFTNDYREVYLYFLQGNPVNGCTILVKKSILEEVGEFDPSCRYTHDYDMWFRLLLSGCHMHYLDEVLIHFRTHEEAGTSKFQPQIQEEILMLETKYRPLLGPYILGLY
ncbi:glycosyltransferase [Bacillus lacus]|uniref:Glycosyltransferase n=1 Tax=Metabacillus lacus TaxID=1983721 RepID=A0A7X2M0J9_9BACI|nr:glycosyltransferase [Metabacillus lacus]MRX74258.1 glycosyltransferase [Metabacillus lacus]